MKRILCGLFLFIFLFIAVLAERTTVNLTTYDEKRQRWNVKGDTAELEIAGAAFDAIWTASLKALMALHYTILMNEKISGSVTAKERGGADTLNIMVQKSQRDDVVIVSASYSGEFIANMMRKRFFKKTIEILKET